MKRTAVIALAAVTLTVAGCTTSDPTPPGSLGAVEEEGEGHGGGEGEGGEGHSEEGASEGEGSEGEGSEGEGSESEAEGGENEAEQTGSPEGEGESAEGEESSEGEAGGENTQAPSGEDLPDVSEMSDDTCVAFFDGAAPVAGQAQDARFLVSRGAVNNLTSLEFSEIDVLAQRIEELASTGNEEQAELIEAINAPFTDLQQAVSDEDAQDSESGEVSYDSIDVDEAEQAQEDFTQSCLSES
ncbi:MAG: hypothetical protein WBG57_10700 [Ornithinimicrobium sp.]